MHHSSKSQCCVLTGDSASGKTESLKHLLDYVVSVVSPTSTSLKAKFSKVLACTFHIIDFSLIKVEDWNMMFKIKAI